MILPRVPTRPALGVLGPSHGSVKLRRNRYLGARAPASPSPLPPLPLPSGVHFPDFFRAGWGATLLSSISQRAAAEPRSPPAAPQSSARSCAASPLPSPPRAASEVRCAVSMRCLHYHQGPGLAVSDPAATLLSLGRKAPSGAPGTVPRRPMSANRWGCPSLRSGGYSATPIRHLFNSLLRLGFRVWAFKFNDDLSHLWELHLAPV